MSTSFNLHDVNDGADAAKVIDLFEKYQKMEEEADDKVLSLCRLRKNVPEAVRNALTEAKGKKIDRLLYNEIHYTAPERIDVEGKIRDIERVIARDEDLDLTKKRLEEEVEKLEAESKEKREYFKDLLKTVMSDDHMPFV